MHAPRHRRPSPSTIRASATHAREHSNAVAPAGERRSDASRSRRGHPRQRTIGTTPRARVVRCQRFSTRLYSTRPSHVRDGSVLRHGPLAQDHDASQRQTQRSAKSSVHSRMAITRTYLTFRDWLATTRLTFFSDTPHAFKPCALVASRPARTRSELAYSFAATAPIASPEGECANTFAHPSPHGSLDTRSASRPPRNIVSISARNEMSANAPIAYRTSVEFEGRVREGTRPPFALRSPQHPA